MKAFERRLLKLERMMNGNRRSLQSLTDEELMLRVTSLLKRASGEQLSAHEEAVLNIRLPPSDEFATMTDEELNSRTHQMLAKLLNRNGTRYIRP